MSNAQLIKSWVRSEFGSCQAADLVEHWLITFFAGETALGVMEGASALFSDFGGNAFYRENKAKLEPMFMHAIQSYAECSQVIADDSQRGWAVGGIMQAIEPVIFISKIVEMPSKKSVRKSIVSLLTEMNGGQQ